MKEAPAKTVLVLDIGKTFSKLTLWDDAAQIAAREVHPNQSFDAGPYKAIDVQDIENWVALTLRNFARIRPIDCIVPVTHGAAAALIRDGALACPVFDYESPVPDSVRADYDAGRDDFQATGSPKLAHGLNLGLQLHWLERLHPELFQPGTQILTYPQYWAWRFSGVAATEITSIGCHTDLWYPESRTPSRLAVSRGWADLFAPLRHASEILGPIRPEWAQKTALPKTAAVHCGIHDSNASILAARGHHELRNSEFTTLSTGTWFVSMRTVGDPAAFNIRDLPEGRDCLVNVDLNGNPVPSSLFMGGREIALLMENESASLELPSNQTALIDALRRVVSARARVLPSYAPGIGPFPNRRGEWIAKPSDPTEVQAAICLYGALVSETCLSLIGARERVLLDGRFAKNAALTRSLPALRPDIQFYVSNAEQDASLGALRLAGRETLPYEALQKLEPLDCPGLTAYAAVWRAEANEARPS